MISECKSDRFAFGQNWQRFAERVTSEHVDRAAAALLKALGRPRLDGMTFLDVGGGSGLHSLAARQLGATVHAFDYDPDSVTCMKAMRARFAPADESWSIEKGSALDSDYLASLGVFDIVYSWGVLHHTGDLWRALDLVGLRVRPGGFLFLALYNDQGLESRIWYRVKRSYVKSSPLGKAALIRAAQAYFGTRGSIGRLLRGERKSSTTIRNRGMRADTDLVDWVGGFPFEVSKPEQIFEFYRDRGFTLEFLKTCGGGLGCNEYVFRAPEARQ